MLCSPGTSLFRNKLKCFHLLEPDDDLVAGAMKEADEVEGLASVAFALPLDVRYLDDLLRGQML